MRGLRAFAEEINRSASDYRMGQFQEIRAQIHKLQRMKTRDIFTSQTIHKDWAFHSGGRKEIQFNIGLEGKHNEWLRYGIEFSLERTQTLPDPMILRPKIQKLNDYLRENLLELEDLRFWYYYKGQRSPTLPLEPIPEELIRIKTFLFWGKLTPRETVKPEEVLFLFDRLLYIYEYVEGGNPLRKQPAEMSKGFQFKAGCHIGPEYTVARSKAAIRESNLRHNELGKTLYSVLSRRYGEDKVGTENDTGRGSRVDLVVRDDRGFSYYEIKTSMCIKTCLREAIGQLMEYSYWPGGNEAKSLVVVAENPMTPDTHRYLSMLRERFHLPVYYQRLNIKSGTLGELE